MFIEDLIASLDNLKPEHWEKLYQSILENQKHKFVITNSPKKYVVEHKNGFVKIVYTNKDSRILKKATYSYPINDNIIKYFGEIAEKSIMKC